ncbi:hypothetical protein BE882_14810 [Listeria monocytogenes]|nr:hypothetical protein [Listeria monocytogenes]EAE6437672.1 hypothetical protein [Listeria monocytogenes]EAG4793416.1 hypothetical protein [Listeria monocytogenes]
MTKDDEYIYSIVEARLEIVKYRKRMALKEYDAAVDVVKELGNRYTEKEREEEALEKFLKNKQNPSYTLTNVKITPEDLSKKVADALKPQSEQALKAKASKSFE